jgi:hypothetical protein
VRLLDVVSALLRGNREVLRDFTDKEAGLLVTLLSRLIANLDRIASVRRSARQFLRRVTDRTLRWRLIESEPGHQEPATGSPHLPP